MKARGIIDGSRIVAALGTTAPTPGCPRSTATTPVAIATATSASVPLSSLPEGGHSCAGRPVHLTKGPPGLGALPAPKYHDTAPRLTAVEAGGGLWEQMCSFASLFEGWRRARAGKRGNASVAEFSANLECNLIQLQNELLWRLWHPGSYEAFTVHEPKERMIYAPAFRDRVVHHAIHAALSPVWERVFYSHSYACRVAKGTHRGADYTQRLVRDTVRKHGKAYAFKADIAKYFQSIDHDVLKRLLRLRIACPDLLWILDLIIETSPGANGVGIPLGNLTSQLFANIYLHELDHYVVNILRISGYVRYMDDFVIVSHDPAALRQAWQRIEAFLRYELRLTLNRKTAVYPISQTNGRAVDFLGYRIYATHRKLRRRSVRKGLRRAAQYRDNPTDGTLTQLTSWYAHARHAEPSGLMRKIFATLKPITP